MKTISKISQILAIVFGLGSLVLFFAQFATITSMGTEVELVGAQLALGSKITAMDATYQMAKSADILFCFVLTAVGLLSSIFSFKAKTLRFIAPGVGLGTAIYMLVIALSKANKFVDTRPLPVVSGVEYSSFVLLIPIALFVFTVFSVAYLLISDALEVAASKGEQLTIPKKVIRFFRDYKSEIKKIVWPGLKEVLKNTAIVLIMCVIVGIFIWALDFGLGRLLELLLGAKK